MSAALQLDAFAAAAAPPPDPPAPVASRRLPSPPIAPPRNRQTARDIERRRLIDQIKGFIVQDVLALARAKRDADENPGITADDVHPLVQAQPLAIALGGGQRATSWVGPWLGLLAKRGLLSPFRLSGIHVPRRSTRSGAHGNAQFVYLDPNDRRAS